ncbi:MAG: sensor histidine kinase [Paracoccus sp. (in: a-proteobacteria)]
MKARSLKIRLLTGGALWTILALIVTGLAILYLFIQTVERSVHSELDAEATRLTALIVPGNHDRPALRGRLPDPRYELPLSGVYWQITRQDGTILRSRSLWDFVIDYDASAHTENIWHFETSGPNGQTLLATALSARFQDTKEEIEAYTIMVAQDRSVLNESIAWFGRDLLVALLVLGAALVLAAIAQVGVGLRPLRMLRYDIQNIRTGETDAVGDRYPTEILPLVSEVNGLLVSQQRLIEYARARASDLAHGLKTPLAVMGTVADQLRKQGDATNADLIEDLVTEMTERIDYQLRLSRLRQRSRTQVLKTPLDDVLPRIVSVLRCTASNEHLNWDITHSDRLYLDIDRNDLVELLGILLENAAQWATSVVVTRVSRQGSDAEILISDDGGKLTGADVAALSKSDFRLDEKVHGHGLGLGIAREIVTLNGGKITFTLSPEGGLELRLRLPLA